MNAVGTHGSRGTIRIVRPATDGPHDGNRTTSSRWRDILVGLGWEVHESESWDGSPCDVLVALHARKSHDSIVRFRRADSSAPLVVCATGTDLYTDVAPAEEDEVLESFRCGSRIVLLQRLGFDNLPHELRERARVIHQSVPVPAHTFQKPSDTFQAVLLANVRPVKDPLTAARAAELLPEGSRVRIVHAGGTIDEGLAEELAAAARECPHFETRGELDRADALALLGSSHMLVSTSRHEGGANVVSEALAYGVPIACTRIPGSLGLLGDAYPGSYPVGDAEALAALLERAATDADFYGELGHACTEQAWLTDPRTEVECWRKLLDELVPATTRA